MTYNFDELNKLSEDEKLIAIQILDQFSKKGSSDIFDKLKYADYEEIPVDIETFLKDSKDI